MMNASLGRLSEPRAFRPGGGLRALVVALVIAALSGVPSAIAMSLDRVDGCGDSCRRCWCKQHSEEVHMRAPCPCCSRNTSTPGVIASTEPAIVEQAVLPPLPTPAVDASPQYAAPLSTFTRPVPHPPPRVALPPWT